MVKRVSKQKQFMRGIQNNFLTRGVEANYNRAGKIKGSDASVAALKRGMKGRKVRK